MCLSFALHTTRTRESLPVKNGSRTMVAFLLDSQLLSSIGSEISRLREAEGLYVTRSEMIRRLVRMGLAARHPKRLRQA